MCRLADEDTNAMNATNIVNPPNSTMKNIFIAGKMAYVALSDRRRLRRPSRTHCKITPAPENGKRGGGSLEQKLDVLTASALLASV